MAMSVILFLRTCIPGMAKVPSPDFHYEIEKRLMNLDVSGFNIVAPRGHAKSSLVAISFVLWHIFLQDLYEYLTGRTEKYERRHKYVVIVSKTYKEAAKRLNSIKLILGDHSTGKYSKPFRALFGNFGQDTAPTWREDRVILKDGTIIESVGTGQQVRGLLHDNQRPTLIVVDDPEDEENTKTFERMRQNRAWLLQGVIPARDPQIGRWVVIGTPQNTQCMVVHLHKALRGNSLWFMNDQATNTSFWSKSEADYADEIDFDKLADHDYGDGDIDNNFIQKEGVLWPYWMSLKELKAQRAMAIANNLKGSYAREYECKIIGDEEQIFLPEYFENTWDGTLEWDFLHRPYLHITHIRGEELDEPRDVPVGVSTAVDPAFSVSSRADRTAIANVACDKDGNVYELPWVYERLHTSVLLDAIDANHNKFKPHCGVIETTAAQIFIAEELYRSRGINYVHDKPQQKKVGEGSRIERLQPYMANGKFYCRKETPLRGELLAYPRGRDDYADAMEKAVRFRANPRYDTPAKTEKEAQTQRMKRTTYFDHMVA